MLDYCTCAPERIEGILISKDFIVSDRPRMGTIKIDKQQFPRPGEHPTPVTYEQAVADAQWRIHMHFQQQMIHGPDGIPYDFDPVAAAEELLR